VTIIYILDKTIFKIWLAEVSKKDEGRQIKEFRIIFFGNI